MERGAEKKGYFEQKIERAKEYIAPAVAFAISIGMISANLGVAALAAIVGIATLPESRQNSPN